MMALGLAVFLIGVMPATHAHAGKRVENPCGKGMMTPCEKKEQMEKRMERHKQMQEMRQRARHLMEEGMDMWVETVHLLQESTNDPDLKKRAAALEKRMRKNISEHKELHKKMHTMRSEHRPGHMDKERRKHEGKGHGERYMQPCNPCNPCQKGGM
jgi:hypothetical protein